MCTAMPVTSPLCPLTSPVWRPQRTWIPAGLTASRMSQAQRIARAGPSKVARMPSPARWIRDPTVREQRPFHRGHELAEHDPSGDLELGQALRRADDVDEEHGGEEAIDFGFRHARAGDELLDRHHQVRLGNRPVIGSLTLEQLGALDVLGQVAAVSGAHVNVTRVLDHECRGGHQRQHLAHIHVEDRRILAAAVPGLAENRSRRPYHSVMPGFEAIDGPRAAAIVPVPQVSETSSTPADGGLLPETGGIVVGAGEASEPVDEDEGVDAIRMGRGSHQRHLRGVAVRDQGRVLRASDASITAATSSIQSSGAIGASSRRSESPATRMRTRAPARSGRARRGGRA